jgi:purine-binding chemotaxis protein CheW
MNRELHIVGFQIGRETYGAPITSLHEIVRVPEITAVPDAPDYMEGVINLRGKIVSVIDLRKRFGATKVTAARRNRILVIEESLVSFQEGGLNCVTGLGKWKGRLIILLDMAKLLESGKNKGSNQEHGVENHRAIASASATK